MVISGSGGLVTLLQYKIIPMSVAYSRDFNGEDDVKMVIKNL